MSRKGKVALVVCGLGILAAAGVYGRHKYVQWRYFREAPGETGARPVVEAPAANLHEVSAVTSAVSVIRPVLAERTDGVIVWEAEWANRVTGSYECLPAEDTGGGFALWSRQGSGRSLQMHYHRPRKQEGDLGTAEYHFTLSAPGSYRLYMRIRAPDHCGNSCWVGMDRRRRLHCFPDGFDSDFHGQRLHWPEKMFKRWLWLEDTGRLFELDAGKHFLRIEVREDGMAIDQVALVPEAGDEPSGMQKPTMIPRDTGDVGLLRLAVDHGCLPRSGEATARGHLWLRSNSATGLPLVVRLAAGSARIDPAAEVRCELGPDAPFAYLPVSVTLEDAARLQAVEVRATASTTGHEGMRISAAPCRVERPFDWRVLGPFTRTADAPLRRALMAAKTVDFGKARVVGSREFQWNHVESPKHFGHLGAVDFTKVFGAREECVVYAATMIDVQTGGVYRVTAAGDDTMELQLDGESLVRRYAERTLTDTLRPLDVELTKGRHLLVARVEQRTGAWQMVVRIEDSDGSAADGIEGVRLTGSGINIRHSLPRER